VSQR